MRNRLKIREAIERYKDHTGQPMNLRILAGMVWPNEPEQSRELKMRRLSTGSSKRVEINVVRRLCKILGVDPNFLFKN